MKLEQLKKDSEIALHGVTIEVERRDASISSITIIDANKKFLKIAIDSYTLHVYGPAKPAMLEKWKLHGTVLGMAVERICDDEYEAKELLRKYEAGVSREEDVKLVIEQTEVPD